MVPTGSAAHASTCPRHNDPRLQPAAPAMAVSHSLITAGDDQGIRPHGKKQDGNFAFYLAAAVQGLVLSIMQAGCAFIFLPVFVPESFEDNIPSRIPDFSGSARIADGPGNDRDP